MSTAVINYGSLKSAAGAAGTTARRMDSYASEIKSALVKQLGSYDGPKGGNVNEAVSELNRKATQLETRADSYKNYETNLRSAHDACVDTDKRVKSRVSSLTASFKNSHGISNSRIVNGISYVLTSFANATGIGRFFNDVNDWIGNQWDYVKNWIKDWYKYDGGRYILGDTVLAVCTAAIAIIGAVAAVISGPVVVAIAAIFLAVTATIGAVVNIVNNKRAYDAAQNGDPATAKRWDQVDTIQDALRKTDSKFAHIAAGILDVCELVANVVTIVDSVANLAKKGYLFISGKETALESFKWKQDFDWADFKNGIVNLKNSSVQSVKTFFNNIKAKEWTKVNKTIKTLVTAEAKNIKGNYMDMYNDIKEFNWDTKKFYSSLKDGVSKFKDAASIVDRLLVDDDSGAGKGIYEWVRSDTLEGIQFKLKVPEGTKEESFSVEDIRSQIAGINEKLFQSDGLKQLLNFNRDSLKLGTKNYKDIMIRLKGSVTYQYNYNNVNYGF